MRRTALILPVLLCLCLSACGATSAAAVPVEKVTLSTGQAIAVDLQRGSLDISTGEDRGAEVSGEVSALQTPAFGVTQEAGRVHVSAAKEGFGFWQIEPSLPHMVLRLPRDVSIDVNSFDATVNVYDFTGKADITSVSGNIDIRNSSGVFIIKSNRGNVRVQTSKGDIHLAGNYGVLSAIDTRGGLSASTIMGMVRFTGHVGSGDNVSLETDHGPVEIQLGQGSDARVHISTTTGVVTCSFPGLSYEGQGCGGTLGTGGGQLGVRTVSGSATINPIP